MITGIGVHDRADWAFTITGIRTLSAQALLIFHMQYWVEEVGDWHNGVLRTLRLSGILPPTANAKMSSFQTVSESMRALYAQWPRTQVWRRSAANLGAGSRSS